LYRERKTRERGQRTKEQRNEQNKKKKKRNRTVKSTVLPAKPTNKQLYDFIINKIFISNVTNVDNLELV
jgi:hypothetical protein